MVVRKFVMVGAAALLMSQAGLAVAAQPVRASGSITAVAGHRLSASARAVKATHKDSALSGTGVLLGLLAAGAIVAGVVGVTSHSDHNASN